MEPLEMTLGLLVAVCLTLSAYLVRRLMQASAEQVLAEERLQRLRTDLTERLEQARTESDLRVEAAGAAARSRLDEEIRQTRVRLEEAERRVAGRDEENARRSERVERRNGELDEREERLAIRRGELDDRFNEVDEIRRAALERLEELSGLSREAAEKELLNRIEAETRSVAMRRASEIEEEVQERSERTAKNIISMAIQRYAGEYVCERTVSSVSLPNDEMKGRIIGREGRNIRSLEAATGVDFIIDDTPETIIISAFNPIRRQVARIALETLLEDGRIHPTRIESVVRKAEAEFHKEIRLAGLAAADEVGVAAIHPEILKLVGALKYRTSYGQNQWQHAIEVAFLCGMMATELGLDVKLAKRAGLLHDIGKVIDQTAEGSHALIGAEFARTHGETDVVVNAIAAHHEEVAQETVFAVLAQAADAMSGARPGARSEVMASYTQRLTDLERISNSFPGVGRSYAVQAGREIRVLVENAEVSDREVVELSRDIANKIEAEMSYPGQIKVTVIRETRVVQYAR